MNIALIKRMMDACYQAKRVRDLLPALPDGVLPSFIQYLDAIQTLEQQGIQVKVSDLSDALSLPRPGVTRTVKDMEARGLLTKHTSPEDGRVTYLTITEAGRALSRKYDAEYFSSLVPALEVIPEEDAETMINMGGQISRGIGHNCPPSIIQLAVAQVLDKTADLSVYETNMNILYKELLDLGFTCVKPGGTFYIFPKALEEDAKVFSQKALKYDLVLVPGDSFGAPGYFRMAYCVDTEKVERSLEALRKFVKTEYATI